MVVRWISDFPRSLGGKNLVSLRPQYFWLPQSLVFQTGLHLSCNPYCWFAHGSYVLYNYTFNELLAWCYKPASSYRQTILIFKSGFAIGILLCIFFVYVLTCEIFKKCCLGLNVNPWQKTLLFIFYNQVFEIVEAIEVSAKDISQQQLSFLHHADFQLPIGRLSNCSSL